MTHEVCHGKTDLKVYFLVMRITYTQEIHQWAFYKMKLYYPWKQAIHTYIERNRSSSGACYIAMCHRSTPYQSLYAMYRCTILLGAISRFVYQKGPPMPFKGIKSPLASFTFVFILLKACLVIDLDTTLYIFQEALFFFRLVLSSMCGLVDLSYITLHSQSIQIPHS